MSIAKKIFATDADRWTQIKRNPILFLICVHRSASVAILFSFFTADAIPGTRRTTAARSTLIFHDSGAAPQIGFSKSPESYDGHLTVIETEKAKGLKALEQWTKENPDTKELFWDVKK